MSSHEIGLWLEDGTLLASATVPAGTVAPLFDGFRYAEIPPIILGQTANLIIAAQYSVGDPDDLIPNASSWRVQPYDGRFGLGSGLPFPDQTAPYPEGSKSPLFLEANFQFVPEPSTWSLLLLALGLLVLLRRKAF